MGFSVQGGIGSCPPLSAAAAAFLFCPPLSAATAACLCCPPLSAATAAVSTKLSFTPFRPLTYEPSLKPGPERASFNSMVWAPVKCSTERIRLTVAGLPTAKMPHESHRMQSNSAFPAMCCGACCPSPAAAVSRCTRPANESCNRPTGAGCCGANCPSPATAVRLRGTGGGGSITVGRRLGSGGGGIRCRSGS